MAVVVTAEVVVVAVAVVTVVEAAAAVATPVPTLLPLEATVVGDRLFSSLTTSIFWAIPLDLLYIRSFRRSDRWFLLVLAAAYCCLARLLRL